MEYSQVVSAVGACPVFLWAYAVVLLLPPSPLSRAPLRSPRPSSSSPLICSLPSCHPPSLSPSRRAAAAAAGSTTGAATLAV